jgi:hypothetical protein
VRHFKNNHPILTCEHNEIGIKPKGAGKSWRPPFWPQQMKGELAMQSGSTATLTDSVYPIETAKDKS